MIQNPSIQGALRDAANNDVWEVVGSGAPTNGTSGTGAGLTGPGSGYTDYTNKLVYINTGTKASPTWVLGGLTAITGDVTVSSAGVSAIGAGKVRPTMLGLSVINKTGVSIATDQLVATSSLDSTSGLPKIVLADADVAALDDIWVTTAAIADGATGVVYRGATSAANLNTNSFAAAGDPVFLSTTAGGFTQTAPSTGISRVVPVGFVLVKSATVGQILWIIGPVRKIGTNEIQAGSTLTTPTITTPVFTDYKVLAASQTYTSTSVPTTLTGFSWTVVPGSYIFEINLPTTMTTNGGLTVSDLLTTAVLASLQAQTYAATASDNTTGVSTQVTATASATKIFDSKTAAYTLVTIKGSFVVTTGGTVAIQATQNTSNTDQTTVLLGAYAKLERVS